MEKPRPKTANPSSSLRRRRRSSERSLPSRSWSVKLRVRSSRFGTERGSADTRKQAFRGPLKWKTPTPTSRCSPWVTRAATSLFGGALFRSPWRSQALTGTRSCTDDGQKGRWSSCIGIVWDLELSGSSPSPGLRGRLSELVSPSTSVLPGRSNLPVGSSRSATSCLAVADSQGEVWSLEITQNISSPRLALAEGTDPMTVDQDASGISAAEPLPIGVKDKRAASQLRWISSGPHVRSSSRSAIGSPLTMSCSLQPQLVYTKLGTANFATLTLDVPGATRKYTIKDDVEVELQTEGASDWVGATSLATCCGTSSLPLVLALAQICFARHRLPSTPPHDRSRSLVLLLPRHHSRPYPRTRLSILRTPYLLSTHVGNASTLDRSGSQEADRCYNKHP